MISAQQRLLHQDAAAREPQPVRIPVPRVIRGTALLFIGFFVVTASLVLISRSTGVRFDLFDTYANILPGQPWANAEAYGFECIITYNDGDPYGEACSLRPATGIFSPITVNRYYSVIDSVIFTPRENALTLGEVALSFGGQSNSQRSRNSWYLDEIRAVVPMAAGQFSYFQPVRAIYLYYRPLPDLDGD